MSKFINKHEAQMDNEELVKRDREIVSMLELPNPRYIIKTHNSRYGFTTKKRAKSFLSKHKVVDYSVYCFDKHRLLFRRVCNDTLCLHRPCI